MHGVGTNRRTGHARRTACADRRHERRTGRRCLDRLWHPREPGHRRNHQHHQLICWQVLRCDAERHAGPARARRARPCRNRRRATAWFRYNLRGAGRHVPARGARDRTLSTATRACPTCGSTSTTLTQRGLAGATDERDQYYRCGQCGRVTFEIVSRTPREIRIGRLEMGRSIRLAGGDYIVSRVLKVGLNESLVYLKPSEEPAPTPPRPAHH